MSSITPQSGDGSHLHYNYNFTIIISWHFPSCELKSIQMRKRGLHRKLFYQCHQKWSKTVESVKLVTYVVVVRCFWDIPRALIKMNIGRLNGNLPKSNKLASVKNNFGNVENEHYFLEYKYSLVTANIDFFFFTCNTWTINVWFTNCVT